MKITLACAGGMSTTMLVKRMEKAAQEKGIELEIGAYPVSQLESVAQGSDIILLGPQVAYQEDDVRKNFSPIPVMVINMMDYGMMNGEKVLTEVLNILEK